MFLKPKFSASLDRSQTSTRGILSSSLLFSALDFQRLSKSVGTVGLNWLDFENKSCGVGYWISEHQTGQGIVTRSCSRLIDHCFNDLNLHRFVLEASVENVASCNVADRLGMRLEGVNKDREWLYNRYVDGKMYAITKPEWLSASD